MLRIIIAFKQPVKFIFLTSLLRGSILRNMNKSAVLLRKCLDRGGVRARRLREVVDGGTLSRLARGLRMPSLATAVEISMATHGEVPISGWLVREVQATDGEA